MEQKFKYKKNMYKLMPDGTYRCIVLGNSGRTVFHVTNKDMIKLLKGVCIGGIKQ